MPDASEGAINSKRHAKLGPSSSDIWLTCLGAPAEWEKWLPRPPGFAAKEGTLAHTLCEAAVRIQDVPWTEGMTFEVEGTLITVTQEMLNAVSLYARTVTMIQDFALWAGIEKEVSFAWLWGANAPADDLYGTSDFAACDPTTLYVVDFKYGRGKAVQPFKNTQLLLYALGAYGQLERERPDLVKRLDAVCLVIIQPRAGGEPVRQWVISVGELLYWAFAVLKPSIDKILSKTPQTLVPGNHCYFCQASFGCPAYAQLRRQTSIQSFPDWTEAEVDKV